jgi:tetratricopeptide (TPR) repeat protein
MLRMRHATLILLAALAQPAFADCPVAPDHSEALGELIAEVRKAPNDMAARVVSNQMWELWADAPDEIAQSILDSDRLVDYCPDYAEGYNQRAFVNFLRQDYAAALPDPDRAIELSPLHIAAIAGKALTLMGLRRDDEAQRVLREAVALNPWLNERHLLKPPPGTDL